MWDSPLSNKEPSATLARGQICGAFSWLLIDVGGVGPQSTVGSDIPRQVVLGSLREQGE